MTPPKTGGRFFYGWSLVAVSVVIMFFAYSIRYSLSVVYPVLIKEFGWSRGSTALVFSIHQFSYGLTAMVVGFLVERFGPKKVVAIGLPILGLGLALSSRSSQLWQLYLFLGAITAIGINCTGFLPNSVMLSRWFIRWRGGALGVMGIGGSVAFLIGLPLQYFMSLYDWRGAYLILAALEVGVGVPLVLFFYRSRPQDMGLLPDGSTQTAQVTTVEPVTSKPKERRQALLGVMKTPRFWAIYGSYVFIWGAGWYLIIAHIVAFIRDVGYSEMFAAYIFGLYGVVYGVSHVLGFVSDIIGREKAFTLGAMGAALGVILLLLVHDTTTPWLLYGFVFSFALGMGIAAPATLASVADIYKENFASVYGLVLSGFAFGAAFSSWLGGFIFDVTGSYSLAFELVLVAIGVSVVLLWLAAPRKEGIARRHP